MTGIYGNPQSTMYRAGCRLCAACLLICIPSVVCSQSLDEVQPPHDDTNGISCGDCHVPFGTAPDPVPEDWITVNICLSCHIEGGVAPEQHVHVSSTETLAWCQDCHDPHQHQDVFPHWYIKDYIYTPHSGGRDLAFRDSTDFIHGTPGVSMPYDGVCETCHTQTTHHRNDGSAPAQDHNNSSNCLSCHPHEDGFQATSGGCLGCHDKTQPNGAGDYRRVVADTLGLVGDFARTSHHYRGLISEGDCIVCHDMGLHQSLPDPQVMLKNVDTGDSIRYTGDPASLEAFCLACHDADGAGGDMTPFTDDIPVPDISSGWAASAHKTGGSTNSGYTCMGDGINGGCHGNAHGSEKIKLLAPEDVPATPPLYAEEEEGLCYNCHDGSPVINMPISRTSSINNIQDAFASGAHHPVADTDGGHTFSIGGDDFELECTTCHNPHTVTGKYWDAEAGLTPVTRPDFSDPVNNPTAMGSGHWGQNPGEKMGDFAALASGSGGWYRSVARGGQIVMDQPAVYQPPKEGSGWVFEFAADKLPDYPTFCLDCHTHRINDHPPVNWGQGIACTDNSVDPPDQRVECGAQHGLAPANKPSAWGLWNFYGSSGNPDPIFSVPNVPRGRGATHFMRWPYENADRNAGINFVMSCTDCHEAHGGGAASMLRTTVNAYGPGTSNWNTMCNNCHYYYGAQHAGMSCGNASCHEANSIHRIIHVTHSYGTDLWNEPSRPTTTPEILSVTGLVGSDELTAAFTEPVWGDTNQTEALDVSDFLLSDVDGNNSRSIESVVHVAGDSIAIFQMSAALTTADVYKDILATLGVCVWDADNEPAGPWPVTITACPETGTAFEFNESAGSSTAVDTSGLLVGTVNKPSLVFPGDGYFHSAEDDSTWVVFENNTECLQWTQALTIEVRINPSEVNLDYGDTTRNNTSQTLWQRKQSILLRLMRADWAGDSLDASHTARLICKYRPVDRHGGRAWKQVSTDKNSYPITRNHWYRIKLVFNSDKLGVIPGSNGIPVDIWIDDEGVDGNGTDENWSGYRIASWADPFASGSEEWRAYPGDEITPVARSLWVGTSQSPNYNFRYNGVIDWMIWQPVADYSGVDDPPN